ncbi:hypothetical protein ACJRO7_028957 [Eucalyptus globulus]|uniref:Uncharacterized protein n=1 Tax=Eucalyptus globulus TaxID=34317 RepID=A0ABD3K0Z8_EUCGL
MRKQIKIRGHDHLIFCHEQEKRVSTYECNGCQQPGLGPYYSGKEGCNLQNHPCCSELLSSESSESSSAASVSNHRPYLTGDLVLKERAQRKGRCCVARGDEVRMLRYKWRHKKAHGSRNPHGRLHHHLNYQTGEHKIVLELMERVRGDCFKCKGNAKGWAYSSTGENYSCHVGCMKKKIIQRLQQKEAQKSKLIIHVKETLRQILEIVKVAFQLIIGALFGSLSANLADIVGELFAFTYALPAPKFRKMQIFLFCTVLFSMFR